MHLYWIFLRQFNNINNFFFQNGEGCPQSIPTITFVHSCPKNITEIIKAKERKQCYLISQNCTTPDKFEYHCLPNKYINKFVEVCASKTVIVGKKTYYIEINCIKAIT